ncbi:MAG: hypothetical protein ACOH2M_25770 [Cypionkella sp.]
MVWQLLAMWLIVAVTLVWFVRDERHRRDLKLRLQALRFAVTPHYRNRPSPPEPEVGPPPVRRAGLSAENRAFLEDFITRARTDA